MIALSLAAVLGAAAPQAEPSIVGTTPAATAAPADRIVLLGRPTPRPIPLAAFGLGYGGFEPQIVEAASRRSGRGRSAPASPNPAAEISARAEGVHVALPNGKRLLVVPSGRIHLREGGHTRANPAGVELLLGDGSRIRATPRGGAGRPFRTVERTTARGRVETLWSNGNARRGRRTSTRAFRGIRFAVIGDGDAIYRVAAHGPLLVLERAACTPARAAELPMRQVIVLTSMLRASLDLLPDATVRADWAGARQIGRQLAAIAPRLFPSRNLERHLRGVDRTVLPLADGFRLRLGVGPRETSIALASGSSSTPIVEWTIGHRTRLHLIRPDGGTDGRPIYAMRGIELDRWIRGVLPAAERTSADTSFARRVLRELANDAPSAPLEAHRR